MTSSAPPPAVRVSKLYQAAVVGLLVVLAALGWERLAGQRLAEALLFLVLTAVALRLNIRFRSGYLGLESVTIMPAIILLGSPIAGAAIAFIAFLLSPLLGGKLKRPDLLRLFDAAQLGLSYFAAGMAWRAVAGSDIALPYLLLPYAAALGAQLVANTALLAVYFWLERRTEVAESVGDILAHQLLSFAAVTPIALIMVLLHRGEGIAGVLLAFVPVVLASYTIRFVAESRRSSGRLAKRSQELTVLREVSSMMNDARVEQRLFDRYLGLLQRLAPVRSAAALFWEILPNTPRAFIMGESEVGSGAVIDWMVANGLNESLDLGDTTGLRRPGQKHGIRLLAANSFQLQLPLQTPEIIFGVLIVEGTDSALDDEETHRLLTVVADHTALTIQDNVLREQMQEKTIQLAAQAETLQKILDISNELKSDLDLDILLSNITRAVSGSLGFSTVLLSLYDKNKGVFERRAQAGLDHMWDEVSKIKVPKEEVTQFFAEEYRMSKSYFVDHSHYTYSDYDVLVDRGSPEPRKGEWHPLDMLFIPLTQGEELVGYLSVDEPKENKLPSLEDVRTLEIFANQAVAAIQTARRYELTKLQTITDGLTDAFNHRFFQQTLIKEISRHERTGRPMALAMVDIDDFKSINDSYGHPVGDAILKELVADIKISVREMDLVARYGGEEFALILPDLEMDRAVHVADRIRRRIADKYFRPPEVPAGLKVTISIGLACYPDDSTEKVGLIERADQALYHAKHQGKNRVVLASTMSDTVGARAPVHP